MGNSNSRSNGDGSRNPLISTPDSRCEELEDEGHKRNRGIVGVVLTLIFLLMLCGAWIFFSSHLSDNPDVAAKQLLAKAPIIDGHIDLPILVRSLYSNNISRFNLNDRMPGQVDIPRLREGQVGAFFWSVYVECKDDGTDFTNPSNEVRDTLEQIDVAKLMIEAYPDTFRLALTSDDIEGAFRRGKIAGLLGVEGAHQLGNSLAVLRQYHTLGVRYVTLTHTCHNAFADSCGLLVPKRPLHHGLSRLGRSLVAELNRLGVLVDLSHTSDDTAKQVLKLSKAPVIWSHSAARAVHNVARNVPDEILEQLGTGKGQTDGVVMVNFAPYFIAPKGKANVEAVANHIDHIGNVAGRKYVGIGSDFDGIGSDVPVGLEDVSKYPKLFSILIQRGWSRQDLAGLAGTNLLRVLRKAEEVSADLKENGAQASMDLYPKRPDLPVGGWVWTDEL